MDNPAHKWCWYGGMVPGACSECPVCLCLSPKIVRDWQETSTESETTGKATQRPEALFLLLTFGVLLLPFSRTITILI